MTPALFDRSIEARPNRAWAELTQLAAAGHAPRLRLDPERHHAIFSGVDEGELDRTVKAVARQLSPGFQISDAAAAVRLRLQGGVLVEATHSVVEARHGEFARVKLLFWSGTSGSGFKFERGPGVERIPLKFLPTISRALRLASEGLFADLHVSLRDGAWHDPDSTDIAFEAAARATLKDDRLAAVCELVEPVGRLEFDAPGAAAPALMGELERRTTVLHADMEGEVRHFVAEAPASRLLGLQARLNDLAGEPLGTVMSLCGYRAIFEGAAQRPAPVQTQDVQLGALLATALGVAFPVGVATAFEGQGGAPAH